jgi:hypothetical protein
MSTKWEVDTERHVDYTLKHFKLDHLRRPHIEQSQISLNRKSMLLIHTKDLSHFSMTVETQIKNRFSKSRFHFRAYSVTSHCPIFWRISAARNGRQKIQCDRMSDSCSNLSVFHTMFVFPFYVYVTYDEGKKRRNRVLLFYRYRYTGTRNEIETWPVQKFFFFINNSL